MFRITPVIVKSISYNRVSIDKVFRSRCTLFQRASKISEIELMMRLAETFSSERKFVTAHDIYRKIIERNPDYYKAYEKLLISLKGNKSEITDLELDNFINTCREYIIKSRELDTNLPVSVTITANDNNHQEVLMKLAANLESEGSIAKSEKIYKTIIEMYPTFADAYQNLWKSWVNHGFPKYSPYEFDFLQRSYLKYIDKVEKDEKDESLTNKPRR